MQKNPGVPGRTFDGGPGVIIVEDRYVGLQGYITKDKKKLNTRLWL